MEMLEYIGQYLIQNRRSIFFECMNVTWGTCSYMSKLHSLSLHLFLLPRIPKEPTQQGGGKFWALSCIQGLPARSLSIRALIKGSHIQVMRQENTDSFDFSDVLLIGFSVYLMEMKYLFSHSPFNFWCLKILFM